VSPSIGSLIIRQIGYFCIFSNLITARTVAQHIIIICADQLMLSHTARQDIVEAQKFIAAVYSSLYVFSNQHSQIKLLAEGSRPIKVTETEIEPAIFRLQG